MVRHAAGWSPELGRRPAPGGAKGRPLNPSRRSLIDLLIAKDPYGRHKADIWSTYGRHMVDIRSYSQPYGDLVPTLCRAVAARTTTVLLTDATGARGAVVARTTTVLLTDATGASNTAPRAPVASVRRAVVARSPGWGFKGTAGANGREANGVPRVRH